MDNMTNPDRMTQPNIDVNQAEIDQLLREMGGNWGVDVIELVMDTPIISVTTDNGLERGDLYGGEFLSGSERVAEILPESQLIDAMWPEDSDPMVILDSDKFPDLGMNSFDKLLVNDNNFTMPSKNIHSDELNTEKIADMQSGQDLTPPPPQTESEASTTPTLQLPQETLTQAKSPELKSPKSSSFYIDPIRPGTKLRF